MAIDKRREGEDIFAVAANVGSALGDDNACGGVVPRGRLPCAATVLH
jgi:hypothetical protein